MSDELTPEQSRHCSNVRGMFETIIDDYPNAVLMGYEKRWCALMQSILDYIKPEETS